MLIIRCRTLLLNFFQRTRPTLSLSHSRPSHPPPWSLTFFLHRRKIHFVKLWSFASFAGPAPRFWPALCSAAAPASAGTARAGLLARTAAPFDAAIFCISATRESMIIIGNSQIACTDLAIFAIEGKRAADERVLMNFQSRFLTWIASSVDRLQRLSVKYSWIHLGSLLLLSLRENLCKIKGTRLVSYITDMSVKRGKRFFGWQITELNSDTG